MRCIVRPRQNPADFLRDWGATTVQADLGDPTSLPATLVGIHTVIDCATARPEEPSAKIDWVGKKSLIQCAQVLPFSGSYTSRDLSYQLRLPSRSRPQWLAPDGGGVHMTAQAACLRLRRLCLPIGACRLQ